LIIASEITEVIVMYKSHSIKNKKTLFIPVFGKLKEEIISPIARTANIRTNPVISRGWIMSPNVSKIPNNIHVIMTNNIFLTPLKILNILFLD
jgi:hypothetical protein